MNKSKTVDNLGSEVHQRYIDGTKLLSEEELIKVFQSPNVAKRAEVLTTAPKYPELDLLWGFRERETSPFVPPPNFVLTTNVFIYQLIPSFGPDEKLLEKLDYLKAKEEDNEQSEQEKQRKRLLKFAALMSQLNKIISDIKKRKDEYHKG